MTGVWASQYLYANITFYLPSAVLYVFFLLFFFFLISSLHYVAGPAVGPENLGQMHYDCNQMTLSLFSVQGYWVKWDISNASEAISQLSSVCCVSLSYLLMRMKVERSEWVIKEDLQEVVMWFWLKDRSNKVLVIIHFIHSALIYQPVPLLVVQSLFPHTASRS